MNYEEIQAQHRKTLKKHGLNIFDPFVWENLTTLYTGFRHIYRRGISEDKEGAKRMLKAMWAAMVRQAESYESEYATTERTDWLQEMKNS